MYFEFSEFYKRDVYFEYNDDNNISQYDFSEGIKIEEQNVLLYEVDIIDNYIKSYDILPTFGPLLVSEKFKQLFIDLEKLEIQFFPAKIIDSRGNFELGFYALNVLNKIPCLDEQRSVTNKTSYGTLRIKKLFIVPNSLKSYHIVRMEEHNSYIIVNADFKNRCVKAGLKGCHFIEEGHTV